MTRIIDLSMRIDDNMPVYPGDEAPRLQQSKWLDDDHYTDHRLTCGMHVGTHIDAPMHMLAVDTPIADYPLEQFYSQGLMLDVRGQSLITLKPEYETLISESCILLLHTGHSERIASSYYATHPVLDNAFARFLVQRKIKALGIDTPSPDEPPFPVHKLLLGAGIFIIENLVNLEALSAHDNFTVAAFPLKLNANAAPARVAAIIG